MTFERQEDNGIVVYAIKGDFTIFFLNNIKQSIEKDIAQKKANWFEFDLSDTTYIDSAAISLLIMAGKYNDDNGKPLYIRKPKDVVKRIIDNAELTFVEYL